MSRDNIENGMVIGGEPDDIVVFTCAWCGEPIYNGNDYYDLDGDAVCEDCMLSARKTA